MRLQIALTLLLIAGLAGSVCAAEPDPAALAATVPGPTAAAEGLTEQRVLDLALAQNLGVRIAAVDKKIGETGIPAAQSVFDTIFSLEANQLYSRLDQPIPVFGTDNRITNFNFGIAKLLPSGTKAELEWTNQRESTNSPFATINPSYEPVIELSVEQPLLKNWIGQQDRGAVAVARQRYASTDFLAQRRVAENVYQVLFDYWAWVTRRQNVTATERSVEEAKRFERIAQQKKSFGLYEDTDVLAARANRLQMENELADAARERENSLGRLLKGLNFAETVTLTSRETVPLEEGGPGREAALATALERRADFRAAASEVETRRIEVSLAKNRKWPELDLLASLQLNGVDPGYQTALSEMIQGQHPAYFFGTEFKWNLENRLAKSEASRAEQEKMKALFQLKQLENQVVQEVEEQWRAVQTRHAQVLANRQIEQLQKEKWQLELKKYETGRSSSDLVIRFQEDYLRAQRALLLSLFEYRMAILGLRLAQNTLIP